VTPRILVLDDDPAVLSLLRTYFGGLGWYVEVCGEPGAALRLAGSDVPFDAVISDLHFTPARNGEGLEIVEQARRQRPHAAVLLFTAAAEGPLPQVALEKGADQVIFKPAPLASLRAAALRAMKKP
jgi:CheY-like chemotaxis protein